MSGPALAFEMPDYAKATREQRASYLSSFVRWLQLKKYQYEVTFSLYMLTRTEKIIFSKSPLLPCNDDTHPFHNDL